MEDKPLHIVELQAQNIMRLRAIRIRPGTRSVVTIGGRNAQGKTSLLESIVMVLGGGKTIPDKPVREGQKAALVVADLGELIISRHFDETGKSNLEVKTKDGAKMQSPQKVLESLVGRVAFDPIAFLQLDDQKQLATLRDIVKLDFTQLDHKRQAAYDNRTDANRELAKLKAQRAGLPPSDERVTATEEEDAIALSTALANANRFDEDLNELEMRGVEANTLVNETKQAIAEMEAKLIGLRERLKAQENNAAELVQQYKTKKEEGKSLDAIGLQKRLDELKKTNEVIRNNNKHRELDGLVADKEAEIAGYEKTIGDVDVEKEKLLTAAKFPVEGLSFNDKGVMFNGIPFNQASAAQRLRVSVGMGIALNPKIRVMIVRDASLLDEDNMQLVAELAEQHDMQVWMERVGDGEEVAVVIEDGEVDENRIENPVTEKPVKTASARKPQSGPRVKGN
jgi:hypothetical protein